MAEIHQVGIERGPSWWRRKLLAPVVSQLTQGISPQKISWTIALGIVLGVFPIMGSTTLVCLLAGWILNLNQPVLHVAKMVVYPLHLALILVFIHFGEKLFGVPQLALSIPEMLAEFKESPMQFVRDFGMAAFHGVMAWMLIAPAAIVIIKLLVTPPLNGLVVRLAAKKEVSC